MPAACNGESPPLPHGKDTLPAANKAAAVPAPPRHTGREARGIAYIGKLQQLSRRMEKKDTVAFFWEEGTQQNLTIQKWL